MRSIPTAVGACRLAIALLVMLAIGAPTASAHERDATTSSARAGGTAFVGGWQTQRISYVLLVRDRAWQREFAAAAATWQRTLGVRFVRARRRADAQLVIGTARQVGIPCRGAEANADLPGTRTRVGICPSLRPGSFGRAVLVHELGHALGFQHSRARCSIMRQGSAATPCAVRQVLSLAERRAARRWYARQLPGRVAAPRLAFQFDGYWFTARAGANDFLWRSRIVGTKGSCITDPRAPATFSRIMRSPTHQLAPLPIADPDGWCISAWTMLNPWQYGAVRTYRIDCTAAPQSAPCATEPAGDGTGEPWKLQTRCGEAVSEGFRGLGTSVGFTTRDGMPPHSVELVGPTPLPDGVTVDVQADRFSVTSTDYAGAPTIDLTLQFATVAEPGDASQQLACRVVLASTMS